MLQDYEIISGRNVNDVLAQTEVVYNPSEVNRYGNKYNIDFDPNVENNDEIDIIFFNTLIKKRTALAWLASWWDCGRAEKSFTKSFNDRAAAIKD